ncbi:hypothetical protein [Fimbriiglobus ruber]|uniref:Uncharacterized protein n=1 Tax=Fimbriiglobus ruber TaxID=1908690 RepID=A0A225DGL0_9BACT|nr:hypothetical protein [Fimbriiglobus ruber]OWK37658.1 hypothetical protein FRUB_06778 [Fimbriiglobus ruber]
MPRPVTCPNCREELDIPAELRGQDVRCAACAVVFVPPTTDVVPTARRQPASTGPDYDDRGRWDDAPRRRRPRPRGSMLWVWLLLFGVVGSCVFGCGGLLALGMFMEFPNFQGYDSAAGRFHAEFPGKPTEREEVVDGPEPVLYLWTEFHREFPDETYFVYYTDFLARDLKPGPDQLLEKACDRAVARTPGSEEVSRQPAMHDGYPARDLVIRSPDSNGETVVRFVLVGKRLYAVGITGEFVNADSQRVRHFHERFRIEADGPAKKK